MRQPMDRWTWRPVHGTTVKCILCRFANMVMFHWFRVSFIFISYSAEQFTANSESRSWHSELCCLDVSTELGSSASSHDHGGVPFSLKVMTICKVHAHISAVRTLLDASNVACACHQTNCRFAFSSCMHGKCWRPRLDPLMDSTWRSHILELCSVCTAWTIYSLARHIACLTTH